MPAGHGCGCSFAHFECRCCSLRIVSFLWNLNFGRLTTMISGGQCGLFLIFVLPIVVQLLELRWVFCFILRFWSIVEGESTCLKFEPINTNVKFLEIPASMSIVWAWDPASYMFVLVSLQWTSKSLQALASYSKPICLISASARIIQTFTIKGRRNCLLPHQLQIRGRIARCFQTWVLRCKEW